MSIMMDEEIKRWTLPARPPLVMEIIQGKTTVAEAARAFDLPPSEIEEWVDDAKQGHGKRLTGQATDIREQYEKQLKGTPGSLWRGHAGVTRQKKLASPAGRGRQIVADVQAGITRRR